MGINANKLRTSYTRSANGSVFLISLKSAANVLDTHIVARQRRLHCILVDVFISEFIFWGEINGIFLFFVT